MSLCLNSQITITQYVPYFLEGLADRINAVQAKFIQMISPMITFPCGQIRLNVISYRSRVMSEIQNITSGERVKIILVFDVRKGRCSVYGSWVILDSDNQPVLKSDKARIISEFQMFNPDTL